VVVATPKSALRHSSPFAIELVQDFFKKHTRLNPAKVFQLSDRFRNLEIHSRLEIGFEGKPRNFEVPSFAVYSHQSEYGIVIFEVETRVTSRYIPPGAECNELEIERTDFLKHYVYVSDERKDYGPRRVSYNVQSSNESPYQIPRAHNK
jgi:hypothetical protein